MDKKKKTVTYAKISPKMVNPQRYSWERIRRRRRREEEEEEEEEEEKKKKKKKK